MPQKNDILSVIIDNNINTSIVFITHPNPKIQESINKILKTEANIELRENMNFYEFIRLLSRAKLVMTDSGGLLQECIYLKKPIIYLRDATEYSMFFDDNFIIEVGKNKNKMIKNTTRLLNAETIDYPDIKEFGDGTAGILTANLILKNRK